MKKRIATIALVLALVATCFSGTLAYLTDTDAQTNTFTTGNVYIAMDEAVVEKDTNGNLLAKADGSRTSENQSYHLYPGMAVTKDPTIYMEGTEPAYVAAIVTVTGDLLELIPMEGSDTLIDINQVVSGGLLSQAGSHGDYHGLPVFQNDNYAVYQLAAGTNTWKLYIFMKPEQAVGAEIELFDTLTIPADWDNEEMAKIDDMTITVHAYAAQANGFADCYTAMTTAFAEDDAGSALFQFN